MGNGWLINTLSAVGKKHHEVPIAPKQMKWMLTTLCPDKK